MRKNNLFGGVAALALIATGAVALADSPGSDWMPIEKALSIVKQHGYSRISEIEADDGHWEGEGMKNGREYEFQVDPHSGRITKDEPERDDD